MKSDLFVIASCVHSEAADSPKSRVMTTQITATTTDPGEVVKSLDQVHVDTSPWTARSKNTTTTEPLNISTVAAVKNVRTPMST